MGGVRWLVGSFSDFIGGVLLGVELDVVRITLEKSKSVSSIAAADFALYNFAAVDVDCFQNGKTPATFALTPYRIF